MHQVDIYAQWVCPSAMINDEPWSQFRRSSGLGTSAFAFHLLLWTRCRCDDPKRAPRPAYVKFSRPFKAAS